ncbi:MAG: zinc-ribbon domain-containing protein [Anaerolineales bacterium]|nr:zinc-ribbon domain-containing protein [Anaerolineales bacterium]
MDLGSLFLILALLILVGLFISRPLLERQETLAEVSLVSQDRERSALLAERDRILNALQELDFDHALGKIPEQDYPGQRAFLLQRGADVLRRLDSLQPEVEEAQDKMGVYAEAAIARRSQPAAGRGVSAAVAAPDDELEVLLANRRRVRQEKAAGFCPQCGGPVRKSDRFCPKCGATMT